MSLTGVVRHRCVSILVGTLLFLSSVGCQSEEDGRPYAGLSVQLWSVKDDVKNDIRSALKQIADMGFDGVEVGRGGEFSNDPESYKVYLESLGLAASGAHVRFDEFTEEAFDESVHFYQTLGVDQLIVSMDPRGWSVEGIDDLVADLNRVSDKLKPYGMKIGYHNHHREFDSYKGTTFWSYLAEETSKDVLLQLDVGWLYFAGQDPASYLIRYRDRIESVHMKAQMTRYDDIAAETWAVQPEHPAGEFEIIFQHFNKAANESSDIKPLIGRDKLDWKSIIDALVSTEDPVWLVVEQEVYPDNMTPMEAVHDSLIGLKSELSES